MKIMYSVSFRMSGFPLLASPPDKSPSAQNHGSTSLSDDPLDDIDNGRCCRLPDGANL